MSAYGVRVPLVLGVLCTWLWAVPGCAPTSSRWIASREEGDKPGEAVVLHVVDGVVIAGDVYILDPDHPGELRSGIGYPIQNLRHKGNTLTGEVVAVIGAEPRGVVRLEFRLVLRESLQGAGPVVGVSRGDGFGQNREWTFTRSAGDGPSAGQAHDEPDP